MAAAVMTFAGRLRLAVAATAVAAAGMTVFFAASSLALRPTAYKSGWLLLGSMLFLALYNVRKKLPYPNLIRSSLWLQLHLYVGALSIVVFLLHIGLAVPNGALEGALAALYVAVAGSGIAGIVFSRRIPPRLSVRGQEVVFERIPGFRRQLREQAEELILRSAEQINTTTLAEFYRRRLADFFAGPRNVLHHLFLSARPLHRLMNELRSLDRYFNDQERSAAAELADLIEAKDALDFHFTLQGLLKAWLFVHVPLTYVLLLFAVLHVVVAYAFSGGAR